MRINELHNQPVQADTYEASMALNQLLKIGKHAIKIHNMIDDSAEMEAWVAKKIDLAGDYVKKVHGYMQGEKAGLYDDGGLTEDDNSDYIKQAYMLAVKHHTDGSGDGNINEDIGDLIEDYNEKATKKISPEQIMRISKKYNAGGDYVEVLSAEGIDGKLWLEVAKEYYAQLESVSEDANSLTDQQKKALDMVQAKYGNRVGGNGDSLPKGYMLMRLQTGVGTDGIDDDELEAALKKYGYDSMYDAEQADDDFFDKIHNKEHLPITMNMIDALSDAMGSDFMDDKKLGDAYDYLYNRDESVSEDAGDMDLIGDGAENLGLDSNKFDYYYDTSGAGYGEVRTKSGKAILQFEYDRDGDAEVSTMDNKTIANIKQGEQLPNNVTSKLNMIKEDAGEGHMSKSTLYHTAKYAIELMDMINKGDDLEGWVQSKLNKAADYLQGVHNYEEYQKLNPYREELDANILQKHAGIVQKHIDEILARETSLDDVDTKPGMMRILAKRVNEVEKEIAKEQRKNTDEAHGGQHSTSGRSMTKGEMNKREKIVKGMKKNKAGFKKRYGKDAEAVMYATATKNAMKEKEFNPNDERDEAPREGDIVNHKDLGKVSIMKVTGSDQMGQPAEYIIQAKLSYDELMGDVELGKFESTNESGILYRAGVKKYGKAGMKAIQSAAAKGANHQEIGKIKDKHLKDDELLDEGLKDWAKKLAAAGVIVGAVAGLGSINNAIDNSVPAVQALNTAYELAVDQGHTELANDIKKDLSAVKLRLQTGRDLNFVKGMQDKYSKFVDAGGLPYSIDTESKAYESKLAILLNQRLK